LTHEYYPSSAPRWFNRGKVFVRFVKSFYVKPWFEIFGYGPRSSRLARPDFLRLRVHQTRGPVMDNIGSIKLTKKASI